MELEERNRPHWVRRNWTKVGGGVIGIIFFILMVISTQWSAAGSFLVALAVAFGGWLGLHITTLTSDDWEEIGRGIG